MLEAATQISDEDQSDSSPSRLLSRCSRLVWDNISVELLHQIII